MKEKVNNFFKISDENLLMIVLTFMSFSIGIWANYRQLWLSNIGFSLTEISRILSVALVCSAIISFVISMFSTKVKIKHVILLGMAFRTLAMACLLLMNGNFLVKTCILITVMCEVIFSISFYPLLSTVNKSSDTYRKHSLINYLAKDAAIVSCGLLIGVTVGKIVFDLNSCLFISMISCILSFSFLLMFNQKNTTKKKETSILKVSKKLLSSKINKFYLFIEFVLNIPYGIIFGLMMLILTDCIGFGVSFASIFIIGCNLVGSLACSLFIKYAKKLSVRNSILIKYGSRVVTYLIAFTLNNFWSYIIAIVTAYVSSRILGDKIDGTYVRKVSDDSQFLFGNLRYFLLSLGEGVGTFLAGYLIQISFSSIFLGAALFTTLQIILLIWLDIIRRKDPKYADD